jgi:hypothetical protein
MLTVYEWFGLKTTRTISYRFGPQNRWRRFVSGLASKPFGWFLLVWPQNQWRQFSPVWSQNWWRRFFSSLTSKLVATVFFSLTSKLVATVSPDLTLKSVVSFLVETQNQGGRGFSNLCLKIGNFGFVIWGSKSPRRFLGLGLKIKWASVCRLRHKTDGGRSAQDTRRDLTACFV